MNINAVTNAVPYLRKGLLFVCLVLPWLNPFSSTPSAAVYPLVISWVFAALLSLSVLTLPVMHQPMLERPKRVLVAVLTATLLSVFLVPEELNNARSMGLVVALICIALMIRAGLQVAWHGNQLLVTLTVAWLAVACLSSMMGLMQYFGLADDWAPWISATRPGSAYANLRQRNHYATLIAIGLVTAFAWVASRSERKAMKWPEMVVAWVLLNLFAAAMATSTSRVGALEWVSVCLLAVAWAWRECRQQPGSQKPLLVLALLGPVLLLLWGMAIPWLLAQWSGETGGSLILRVTDRANDYNACNARTVLWPNMLTLIGLRPWLGWGWGGTLYAHFITPYEGLRFCDYPDNAHSLPLHLALEMGIPLSLLILVLGSLWVWRRQPWAEKDTGRCMAWGVLWVVGLHSMVEYPLWNGPFQMAVGLALGLVWSRMPAPAEALPLPVPKTSPQGVQVGLMCMAMAMFLDCCYTLWDFNRIAQPFFAPPFRDAAFRDDPLKHAMASWVFKHHAEFAKLVTLKVTPENAKESLVLAERVAHYSPELRVINKWIEIATLAGEDKLAETLSERLKSLPELSAPDKMKP